MRRICIARSTAAVIGAISAAIFPMLLPTASSLIRMMRTRFMLRWIQGFMLRHRLRPVPRQIAGVSMARAFRMPRSSNSLQRRRCRLAMGVSGELSAATYGRGLWQIPLLTASAAAQPSISVIPTALTFGGQAVATASSPQTITVTNTGSAPLIVSLVAATGDFSETDTCTAAPIAVSQTCTIQIQFSAHGDWGLAAECLRSMAMSPAARRRRPSPESGALGRLSF